MAISDMDVIEINEAFASVVLSLEFGHQARLRPGQRQRRRHRARPPRRLHRRPAADDGAARARAHRQQHSRWSRCAAAARWPPAPSSSGSEPAAKVAAMALAVTEEQVALAESVSGWAERAKLRPLAREQIDVPAVNRADRRARRGGPARSSSGLLGLALPEDVGGSGATVVELAVAVEELGRHVAHGPFVASAVAGLALAVARRAASDTKATRCAADAARRGRGQPAPSLSRPTSRRPTGPAGLRAVRRRRARLRACRVPTGCWCLPGTPDAEIWAIVDIGGGRRAYEPVDGLDVTRRLARVTLTDAHRAG